MVLLLLNICTSSHMDFHAPQTSTSTSRPDLHLFHGALRFPLAKLLEPAIRLAHDGIVIAPFQADELKSAVLASETY